MDTRSSIVADSPHRDEVNPRVAEHLRAILWTLIGVGTLILVASPILFGLDHYPRYVVGVGFGYLQWIALLLLNAKGKTRLASRLFLLGGFLLVTAIVVVDGGVRSVAAGWYAILIVAAGLLLGEKAGIVTALVSSLLTLALAIVQNSFYLSNSLTAPFPLEHWFGIFCTFIGIASLQYLAAKAVALSMHRAQEELRERERVGAVLLSHKTMLSNILNSIPQYVFWKDRNSTYIGCNTVFARAAGLDRPDLVAGKTDFDLPWSVRDLESYRDDDLQVMRQNTPRLHVIEPLQQADGSRLWIDTSKFPLLDEKGEVSGVLGVYEDITDRVRADDALRKSESFHRALVENTPDIIAGFDQTGHYIFVNSAVRQVSPTPAPEFAGKRLDEVSLFSEEEATHRLQVIQNVYRSQIPFEGEFEFHNAGEQLIFDWRVFPAIDPGGNVISVFSISRDVTGRKRAEEALRKSMSQLHALSSSLEATREQERKAIAREIHDELGQILTAIKMGVEGADRAGRHRRGNAPEKTRELPELIDRAIQAVHRISAQLRPMVLDELGLVAAIRWQVKEFRRRTGVSCSLSLPDSEPEISEDRSTALFRILGELLTNVARHAKASHVEVSLRETRDEFVLSVKDDGIGISESAIQSSRSFGLKGIEERLYPFGGRRTFVVGSGTEAVIQLPKSGS